MVGQPAVGLLPECRRLLFGGRDGRVERHPADIRLARRIRDEAGIPTGAVGLITDPKQADEVVTGGDADLVSVGRELLREPYWALKAQHELGQEPAWPTPYGYAVRRRAK